MGNGSKSLWLPQRCTDVVVRTRQPERRPSEKTSEKSRPVAARSPLIDGEAQRPVLSHVGVAGATLGSMTPSTVLWVIEPPLGHGWRGSRLRPMHRARPCGPPCCSRTAATLRTRRLKPSKSLRESRGQAADRPASTAAGRTPSIGAAGRVSATTASRALTRPCGTPSLRSVVLDPVSARQSPQKPPVAASSLPVLPGIVAPGCPPATAHRRAVVLRRRRSPPVNVALGMVVVPVTVALGIPGAAPTPVENGRACHRCA